MRTIDPLLPRDTSAPSWSSGNGGKSDTDQFLGLLADPFSSELQSTSFFASFAWTFGVSLALAAAFCLLRPRTNAVYAPRAKHADEKHAPPPIDKSLFGWVGPIKNVKELEMVQRVGLDAVVFLRFLRMLRDMFLVLSVVGLGVFLPVVLIKQNHQGTNYGKVTNFMKFTPQYIYGPRFWAYSICAYVFNAIVCGFIWWNYRAVYRLRRAYFESHDYQSSLHSRTLMITHIPQASRTDTGIANIAEQAKATEDVPKTAIARNVKDLPELIEEHESAVKALEKYLAKYLRDPDNIPAHRPTCKPFKNDKAHVQEKQVDAIEYLTGRVHELEREIKQVRESIDQRNPMSYGFASYTHIEDAHAMAFAARKKGPEGTVIRLASKPHDIIWKNLPMSRKERASKSVWNGIWMTVLTVLFVVPNILTAVFLSDFNNLGSVWKGFNKALLAQPKLWGIIQGIVAPAVQSLFYMILPKIFRRLFQDSGDTTKTSRERHVTNRLFAFYVFNQLIVFSLFAALWRFSASVFAASKKKDEDATQAILDNHVFSHIVIGLCNVTPYWMTWQMQHTLGAATDLLQIWPLIKGTLMRKFGNPTPRQMIELSAPPPFEYADYYNNYLFTATVGLCFAVYQPLILPFTAFYLGIEAWLKKYLLQYVFITKTESGGVFWRILINRLLVATVIADCAIAVLVGANGVVLAKAATTKAAAMLYVMIPLPFLIWGFKRYCQWAFDKKIAFYTTKSISDLEGSSGVDKTQLRRRDRVGVRFGNPALYKKLMTPMVAAKSQHVLKEIYSGRLDQDMAGTRAGEGVYGYSDVYMSRMSHERPGKIADGDAPFEVVSESELDFENFKKRPEFREEFGGDGELYGRADDQSRHGSRPGSVASMSTVGMMGAMNQRGRSESPVSDSRASSRTRVVDYADENGTMYPKGYHVTPMVGVRAESPLRDTNNFRGSSTDIAASGHPAFRTNSEGGQSGTGRLLHHASNMGQATPPGAYRSYDNSRPQTPDEDTSYEHFRRGGRY